MVKATREIKASTKAVRALIKEETRVLIREVKDLIKGAKDGAIIKDSFKVYTMDIISLEIKVDKDLITIKVVKDLIKVDKGLIKEIKDLDINQEIRVSIKVSIMLL